MIVYQNPLTKWMDALFPVRCINCHQAIQRSKGQFCDICLDDLPESVYRIQHEHLAHHIFGGRVPIQAVYVLATFHPKSPLQKALHQLKYEGNTTIGKQMGTKLGQVLSGVHTNVDLLIPVPIHPKKLKKRGYNQSEYIAQGLAEALQITVVHGLKRIQETPSQTTLTREERWNNVSEAFKCSDQLLHHSKEAHLGLVDDTLTTGATLEACAQTLLDVGYTKISIFSIGYAQN